MNYNNCISVIVIAGHGPPSAIRYRVHRAADRAIALFVLPRVLAGDMAHHPFQPASTRP
jgi:hypothetical protein